MLGLAALTIRQIMVNLRRRLNLTIIAVKYNKQQYTIGMYTLCPDNKTIQITRIIMYLVTEASGQLAFQQHQHCHVAHAKVARITDVFNANDDFILRNYFACPSPIHLLLTATK